MILDEVDAYLKKFVAFPTESDRHAVVLWAAHAHLVSCFDSTPRLILTSPEKGSGKTRCLEVLEFLVPGPLHTSSISPAAMFRRISEEPKPTVLLDEYDAVWSSSASDGAEDLRALINSGHRRGASTYRCVPPSMEVRAFPTYAAVALAGIGNLPDTITDRGVVIRMRRRAPDELVEPFRYRLHEPAGVELGEGLGQWATEFKDRVGAQLERQELPPWLVDRPADVWEPLLTIGEVHGGGWAQRALTAASSHHGGTSTGLSLGVELLADIRSVWPPGEGQAASADLMKALCDDPEMRWSEFRGKELTARGLASILGPFGIRAEKWRDGSATTRGYMLGAFEDAWARYLPSCSEDPPQAPQAPQPSAEAPHPVETPQISPPLTSDVSDVALVALYRE